MIKKQEVILSNDDIELKNLISRCVDLFNKAEISQKTFYTKFLTPFEKGEVLKRFSSKGLTISFFGGFNDAERCVVAFGEDCAYPISALKITKKGEKDLLHKDYLGSVLSLGIERNLIGDILICQDGAYMMVLDHIKDYILENILKIGNTGVKVYEVSLDEVLGIEHSYDIKTSQVSSLRLDAIVAKCINQSRTKSTELIKRGLCVKNYIEEKDVSKEVLSGDIISVRGYGKFKIETKGNLSKKGKVIIEIYKYI